jgi:hypothetical protein
MTKIAGFGSESGSISQRHGSADPDPYQHLMDATTLVTSKCIRRAHLLHMIGIRIVPIHIRGSAKLTVNSYTGSMQRGNQFKQIFV